MKKLLAQLTVLGTAVIILISFTACGYPTESIVFFNEELVNGTLTLTEDK